MSNTSLSVANTEKVAIAINKEAEQAKLSALALSNAITEVKTAQDATHAVQALSGCKKVEKDMEASRKLVKAPVLEIGKRIDALATEFLEDVELESQRIQKLLANYEAERERQVRQEEIRRQKELQRIEMERREQQEAIEKAERDRLAAQKNESNDADALEAKLEAEERAEQEKEEAREAEILLKKKELELKASLVPEKASGLIVKDEWCFEVLDIHALYLAKPDACKIEAKASVIKALMSNGMKQCPGLRIWCEKRTTTRA